MVRRLLLLKAFATVPPSWCLSGDGDLDAKLDADAAASIAAISAFCASCGPLPVHGRKSTPWASFKVLMVGEGGENGLKRKP